MLSKIKETKGELKYPFGIISDVHLHNWSSFSSTRADGMNTRLVNILDAIQLAARTVIDQGGKDLVITGDLFHTRGSIKPSVLNPTIRLFKELIASGLRIHAFDGNHDAEGKHVDPMGSSMYALASLDGFNVYYEPTLVNEKFLFIPWEDKHSDVLELTKAVSEKYSDITVFCHVGMSGVLPGNLGDTLHPADFDKLEIKHVFSGHFHNHVSFNSRIFSVGALTHQTWGDVDSKAGFLVVNGSKVDHYETEAPKFIDLDEKFDAKSAKNNYIRIKGVELKEEEASDLVATLKDNGALAVMDQSTRPTIKEKDHTKLVAVDLGIDKALETYCKHTYGDNWERVYKECLKLKS